MMQLNKKFLIYSLLFPFTVILGCKHKKVESATKYGTQMPDLSGNVPGFLAYRGHEELTRYAVEIANDTLPQASRFTPVRAWDVVDIGNIQTLESLIEKSKGHPYLLDLPVFQDLREGELSPVHFGNFAADFPIGPEISKLVNKLPNENLAIGGGNVLFSPEVAAISGFCYGDKNREITFGCENQSQSHLKLSNNGIDYQDDHGNQQVHFLRKFPDEKYHNRDKEDYGKEDVQSSYNACLDGQIQLLKAAGLSVHQLFQKKNSSTKDFQIAQFWAGYGLHTLQDSFSGEHALRRENTGYQTIENICVYGLSGEKTAACEHRDMHFKFDTTDEENVKNTHKWIDKLPVDRMRVGINVKSGLFQGDRIWKANFSKYYRSKAIAEYMEYVNEQVTERETFSKDLIEKGLRAGRENIESDYLTEKDLNQVVHFQEFKKWFVARQGFEWPDETHDPECLEADKGSMEHLSNSELGNRAVSQRAIDRAKDGFESFSGWRKLRGWKDFDGTETGVKQSHIRTKRYFKCLKPDARYAVYSSAAYLKLLNELYGEALNYNGTWENFFYKVLEPEMEKFFEGEQSKYPSLNTAVLNGKRNGEWYLVRDGLKRLFQPSELYNYPYITENEAFKKKQKENLQLELSTSGRGFFKCEQLKKDRNGYNANLLPQGYQYNESDKHLAGKKSTEKALQTIKELQEGKYSNGVKVDYWYK